MFVGELLVDDLVDVLFTQIIWKDYCYDAHAEGKSRAERSVLEVIELEGLVSPDDVSNDLQQTDNDCVFDQDVPEGRDGSVDDS